MADQKISELTELAAGNVANDDELAIVDTDAVATKRWTWASIKSDIASWFNSAVATLTNKTIDADNNTITNIGTTELSDEGVTLAKMAHIATNRILGRSTAGTGDVEDLTAAQVRSLINVENGADVTDTANVTAAGALMDSEVDADIKTLVLPANTTISAFGATVVDDANAAAARTTLDVDQAGTDNSTDVTLSGTGTYISIVGQDIQVDPITESDISDYDPSSTNVARVSGSTYSTIQHLQDIFHSVGVTTGGGITDDTDGTITVAAGTGLIRATNSAVAQLLFTDWASEAGANVTLTDNDMNYIYVEYNSGSPQVVATTTERTDDHTNILLGTVHRSGTTLHITDTTKPIVGDHALRMIERMNEIQPFARVSGASISETGTRNFALTAGTFWEGLTKFTTSAFDSSAAGTFRYYYRDGVGGWTEVTSQTQINNTQYDDGSGSLATLSNNRYGVHWVYLAQDDDVYVVYGHGDYTLTQAEQASRLSSLPPHMAEDHARLVGKIVIQKSAATFAEVVSAFTSVLEYAPPVDHGGLVGLSDDDHTQYTLADGTRAFTGDIDLGTNAITNVGNVDGRDVSADGTKLDGIEAGADVTDSTNVDSAGAVMNSDTSTAAMSFVIDEDNMASDSATKVPTQQSVKAYVDTTSLLDSEVDADIKTLSLPANTTISTFGATLVDDASAAAARTTLGISTASKTAEGLVELATTAEIDTGTDTSRAMPIDQFVASKRNIEWIVFDCVAPGTDCAVDTNLAGDFVSPIAGTILQNDSTPFYLYATNSTAGTTGTMVVDIHINGTSIMTTNKLDFDTTEKTTTTAATPPDLTTTSIAVGDIVTIDIDSVHTTPAKGLKVYMAVRQ